MPARTRADKSALRQVSWYLLSALRLVCEFPWQSDANLDLSVDADFAEVSGHSAEPPREPLQ